MTKEDLIRKLTSRKFWVALVAFVTSLLVGFGVAESDIAQVASIIMAAGAFTMGASIELSADAPLREPYAVFMQGGLQYHSGKIGALSAVQNLLDKHLISI